MSRLNQAAEKIHVGTAVGHAVESAASCNLPLPDIPPDLFGHIMPGFKHNLLGIGNLCDKDCRVVFTKRSVVICDKTNRPFLTGWREANRAKLWRISLNPEINSLPTLPNNPEHDPQEEATLDAFSAYDLPSVEALIIYFHAASGYPVRSTWLKAIELVNFASFPGLTLANAKHFFPSTDETSKGHLVQDHQGKNSSSHLKWAEDATEEDDVRRPFAGLSCGDKQATPPPPDINVTAPESDAVNKLHVRVVHHSKLYTDDTGRFPFCARSGNQYVMVAYHSSNVILIDPFKSRKDTFGLAAYDTIMQLLKEKGLLVDLQILDNECSTA